MSGLRVLAVLTVLFHDVAGPAYIYPVVDVYWREVIGKTVLIEMNLEMLTNNPQHAKAVRKISIDGISKDVIDLNRGTTLMLKIRQGSRVEVHGTEGGKGPRSSYVLTSAMNSENKIACIGNHEPPNCFVEANLVPVTWKNIDKKRILICFDNEAQRQNPGFKTYPFTFDRKGGVDDHRDVINLVNVEHTLALRVGQNVEFRVKGSGPETMKIEREGRIDCHGDAKPVPKCGYV